MQITIDEIKKAFFNHLNSEGRHWKSKLEACVDNAFLGYHGQEDYLRLAWDEFGIDTILLTVIDYLDNEKLEQAKVIADFSNAINKLSEYLKTEYSDYYNVPLLVNSVKKCSEKENRIFKPNVKSMFAEYCEKMAIQYSYKPIFAKCLVHYALSKNKISIDEVIDYYEKYYLDRFLNNLVREQGKSLFSKLNYSRMSAKDLLLRMPIAIFEKQGFVAVDRSSNLITISADIIEEIQLDSEKIILSCDKILNKYYETIKMDTRYKVYEHTNPYGNKKRGITRSECRERQGIRDKCIFIESELSIEMAHNVLQNSNADISVVDYYGNPLHLLLFDEKNRLINAFDSVLEAACLLGLKPSYIKACCRGDETHPRYIWKYGEDYLLNHE